MKHHPPFKCADMECACHVANPDRRSDVEPFRCAQCNRVFRSEVRPEAWVH